MLRDRVSRSRYAGSILRQGKPTVRLHALTGRPSTAAPVSLGRAPCAGGPSGRRSRTVTGRRHRLLRWTGRGVPV